MDRQMTARAVLTGTGMAAGLGLFALSQLADAGVLAGHPLLGAATFAACFFATLLAMAGPLSVVRAALGALFVALGVTVLLSIAALGFVRVEDVLDSPQAVLGAVILTLIPLPFWIARHGAGWRDYPALFAEAWAIVVRVVAAWAFVGLVWAVVLLSDALLKGVGIDLIDRMIDLEVMPWLITGGVLGLGLAVVQELSDYVSPYLILRLLRLLLPVVFLVSAVFLLALPLRGVSGLFGVWSFALTLLTMAGVVATLVTTAVDQDDTQATQSLLLARTAQVMALMLPLMAGLGAWAVWVRVAQYGWTPERVFAAQVAALAVGYGVLYALAVARGAGWMARVRQANIAMALVLMAMAAVSMTPVLSAERLSARSMMARLDDGRLPVAELEAGLLDRWGKPGADARALLEERASEPGQEALARRLVLADLPRESGDRGDILAAVAAILPLQPEGATATRDMYLNALDSYRLNALLESCGRQMPGGGAGCVMVVADLVPGLPGEEALLLDYSLGGFVQFTGFRNDAALGPVIREVLPANGVLPQYEAGEALIRKWQAAPPPTMPLAVNQLNLPEGGGLILAP
ncbi:MAG: DUF4153 domain-containing protein [Pseudotabrizicola sp.]|uniref:DUF4153 domain-containing protein n=1 Tax=Pseudotabrizicola sp. TaxID=2939647 RepID=UPI00271BEFC0|nr:DUF4153 domain-containing protein [Pseudotabrizicola sp.]MDO8882887.1 DUF4153 domain-containing protein [Pseudotabrizicola sp.]MDP2081454.1 DUF4153 domain-containing protein [Pseudotabrizicola sp.]MDZ7572967.1 DUF4153 domain-containing protein [Pseudotabrizicola sp.]